MSKIAIFYKYSLIYSINKYLNFFLKFVPVSIFYFKILNYIGPKHKLALVLL
jgi:hypothetical protein